MYNRKGKLGKNNNFFRKSFFRMNWKIEEYILENNIDFLGYYNFP